MAIRDWCRTSFGLSDVHRTSDGHATCLGTDGAEGGHHPAHPGPLLRRRSWLAPIVALSLTGLMAAALADLHWREFQRFFGYIETVPSSPQARTLVTARAWAELGQFREGAARLERVARRWPHADVAAAAWWNAAVAYASAEGAGADVIRCAAKAAESVDPGSAVFAFYHSELAKAHSKRGQADEAATVLRQAFHRTPILSHRAWLLASLMGCLRYTRSPAEALVAYEELADHDPRITDHPDVVRALAQTYAELGDSAKADQLRARDASSPSTPRPRGQSGVWERLRSGILVTQWLRNPDVLLLAPLLGAFACTVLLAATRRALPPEMPLWRVLRGVALAAMLSAIWGASSWLHSVFPRGAGVPQTFQVDRPFIASVSALLSIGVVLGALVPTLIEGRQFRQMGWRAAGTLKHVLAALVVGAAVGVALTARADYNRIMEVVTPASVLALILLAFVQVAWTEENVFRGHLLPSLREAGLSDRVANVVQAIVFSAYHLPASLVRTAIVAPRAPLSYAWELAAVTWFVWGIIFGAIRLRTRSIVPGFVLHGAVDSVYLLVVVGSQLGNPGT